jgi:drug/metabolite transporter (DMT)-like permease
VSTIERRVLTDTPADTVRGIGFAMLAYIIWTLGDTAAKWVLPVTGVALAMLWRGAIGAVAVGVVAVATPGASVPRMLIPVRWGLTMVRGLISSAVSIIWYIAWGEMSLIDTYAVGFTAPLIMTLLAIPMLGERLRPRRLAATTVGFIGVLVMLHPEGDLWKPVVALLLFGIVLMSVTRIMTRQLSVTETPECQAFWLMISHLLSGAATLWLFPPLAEMTTMVWLCLTFLGISSGLAHCVNSRAYGLAPVSALAPYEYTTLIWGGIAGYLAFGETPTLTTLAGAAIIVAAGLYNLHRERAPR